MLRVTIELWPHGLEQEKTILGSGTIANNLSGTATKGNYNITLKTKGENRIYKECKVEGFPRKNKTAWELLYLALKEIYEKKT